MSKIQLIIEAEADEPALFFGSIKAAEVYLEAIDVKNGVYKSAFGPTGEVFSIATDGKGIFITPRGIVDSADLERVLRQFLKAVKVEASSTDRVADLLRKCEPYLDR